MKVHRAKKIYILQILILFSIGFLFFEKFYKYSRTTKLTIPFRRSFDEPTIPSVNVGVLERRPVYFFRCQTITSTTNSPAACPCLFSLNCTKLFDLGKVSSIYNNSNNITNENINIALIQKIRKRIVNITYTVVGTLRGISIPPIISLSCLPFVAVTAISFINLFIPLNPLMSPTLVTFSLTVSAGSKSHTSTHKISSAGVSTGLLSYEVYRILIIS